MNEAGQRIASAANSLGITMEARFVPWSQSRNKAEKLPSLNWRVTLHKDGRAFLETDYSAGCGHAPGYKQNDHSVDRDAWVKWECEHGRAGFYAHGLNTIMHKTRAPIDPKMADVLYSLVSDSDVLDASSFEEWAGNLGYDVDSRKAETIYRACLDIALKLRNAIGEAGLTKLREACQDY